MWEIKSDGVYSTLQWALSACSSGTCGYKSVTVHSWGSGERPQQWALSVHFPNIYWGCYTRFNILAKFHLVLPLWPSLTSILSATEMPDCPPYRPLNELSVPLWHGSSSLLLLSTWTQQKLDNGQNWCSFRDSASSTLRDVLDLKQPCNPGELTSDANASLDWIYSPSLDYTDMYRCYIFKQIGMCLLSTQHFTPSIKMRFCKSDHGQW